MGQDNVTIKNLVVVAVNDEEILVDGLVPGIKNGLLVIHKVGESKKFVPVWKPADDQPAAGEEKVEEEVVEQPQEETPVQATEDAQAAPSEPVEEPVNTEEPKEEIKAEEIAQEPQEASSVPAAEEQEKKEEVNEDASK
jgi:hypothetical protein